MTSGPQLFADPDGIGHPAFERIVRINQQEAGVGINIGVGTKGRNFIGETLYPGMGMSSPNRYPEKTPGQHVRCGVHAANVSGPGSHQGTIRTMRPA